MFLLQPHQYKALPWVPTREWREPSLGQPKDQLGNQNQVRFRLTARLNDGFIKWRGWFDSREDADAFLYALARTTLGETLPAELWRLPTPAWHPGVGPWVTYDFATLVFLTTGAGSNQTYTSASDWNNANNSVDTLGAGASGAVISNATGLSATGGGGGAWNQISNFNFATPGTTTATWQAGLAGPAVVANNNQSAGTTGGDSWFNGTTLVGSSVASKGGTGGVIGTNAGATGATGGVGASGVGTLHNDGGAGGSCSGGSSSSSGGGGAAGSSGAGGAGATAASGSNSNGGAGDNGVGGAGGILGARPGQPGTEWDGTHGSGGGGIGTRTSGTSVSTGLGGNYGGGGGSITGTATGITLTSGAGIQGIVALTYTPAPAGGFVPWSIVPIFGPIQAQ